MGLTNDKDPLVKQWLNGRQPEFAKWSNGLGDGAVGDVIDLITSEYGASYITENGDVPETIVYQGQSYPLGRYLRDKIRENYGFP